MPLTHTQPLSHKHDDFNFAFSKSTNFSPNFNSWVSRANTIDHVDLLSLSISRPHTRRRLRTLAPDRTQYLGAWRRTRSTSPCWY